MRQRTKIGTRFGVRHQHAVGETFVEHTTFEAEVDDLTTEQEAERRARMQLARCRKQKRGCKVAYQDFDCGHCGEELLVTRHVVVAYSTRKP